MLWLPKAFPNVTIEQVVASCGKTAYVENVHDISYLGPPPALCDKWRNPNCDLKFRFGRERLLNEQQVWLFAQDFKGGGLLSSAFRRLTAEAGILSVAPSVYQSVGNNFCVFHQSKISTVLRLPWQILMDWYSYANYTCMFFAKKRKNAARVVKRYFSKNAHVWAHEFLKVSVWYRLHLPNRDVPIETWDVPLAYCKWNLMVLASNRDEDTDRGLRANTVKCFAWHMGDAHRRSAYVLAN